MMFVITATDTGTQPTVFLTGMSVSTANYKTREKPVRPDWDLASQQIARDIRPQIPPSRVMSRRVSIAPLARSNC